MIVPLWKFRIVLAESGLLHKVQRGINKLDSATRIRAQVEFRYKPEIDSEHSALMPVMMLTGFSDRQIRDLFDMAAQIPD